jgi:hypothetical protein
MTVVSIGFLRPRRLNCSMGEGEGRVMLRLWGVEGMLFPEDVELRADPSKLNRHNYLPLRRSDGPPGPFLRPGFLPSAVEYLFWTAGNSGASREIDGTQTN